MINAGFFRRLIAWLIDHVILSVISLAISIIFGAPIGVTKIFDNSFFAMIGAILSSVLILILFFLQFLYFGFFWSKDGQSIGKRMMGIKVIRFNGHYLSFIAAGLRGTLGYWLSGLIFSLGYIWAALDPRCEAWHDKIFSTWVIRA